VNARGGVFRQPASRMEDSLCLASLEVDLPAQGAPPAEAVQGGEAYAAAPALWPVVADQVAVGADAQDHRVAMIRAGRHRAEGFSAPTVARCEGFHLMCRLPRGGRVQTPRADRRGARCPAAFRPPRHSWRRALAPGAGCRSPAACAGHPRTKNGVR